MIYLVKDNDELVSHCTCEEARIAYPGQVDCPWCGCGWLFSCMTCRKAFTFARGVELDVDPREFALIDLSRRFGREPTEEELDRWVEAMPMMLEDVERGKRYVYLDGFFIPANETEFEVEGWFGLHTFDRVPQIEALEDPELLDAVLANADYWRSVEITEEDDENEEDESA